MTTLTLLLVFSILALSISVTFNYYQKRERSKTLRLLAAKSRNITLAIRSGNIAVWGYDVKIGRLYNIEGKVFSKNEVTIQEAMSGVHPDDFDKFSKVLQGVVAGVLPDETICIRFKNPFTSRWEYIEKEFSVIKSCSGEVETVIGTHKDITKKVLEAREREKLLDNYRQLYAEKQVMINTLPVGMSLYDKDGVLTYMNPIMCDLLGVIDHDKLIGSHSSLWNNNYLNEQIRTKLRNEGNAIFNYQIDCSTLPADYYNPTDRILYISCIYNVIRNKNAEIVSYIFMHLDVTVQERQAQEIKEVSETLIHVIDASGYAVWEYPINERKFYTYCGDMCVADGTLYEDVIANHTPGSAKQCNTIFENIIGGVTQAEHAVFEIVDHQSGAVTFYDCDLIARKDSDGNIAKIYGVQKDVTDEHNYQLELEESKLKTQLAIRMSDMVQWEYDIDKRIFYTINEKCESDIMTADDYYKVTHPDDLHKLVESINLMNSKRNETFELDVRFKFPLDSEWQYITLNGTPLKQDKTCTVIKFTGFQRNNTKWHNLTNALKAKDDLNELILNNVSSGLVYLSEDRVVIWENVSKKFTPEFCNGYPLFVVGKSCHETHMGLTQQCKSCMLEDMWEHTDALTIERTLDNGNVLELVGNKVLNDQGNRIGTILRIDDITQRKEDIKKLKKTEMQAISANQLLHTILDTLPLSVFVKNVNDNYKYIIANKELCRRLGVSEQEILDKTDYDIFPTEEADQYLKDDRYTVESNQTKIINAEMVTMKDSVVVCYTVKTPLINIDNNNQRLLVGISLDISESHRAYQELAVAKTKAEESDRLKSAFLANMSHEIRTPLNAIVGFSELMQTSDDQDTKDEYMRIISANNELLLRLINDILDLSKLESGIVQFQNSTFDLVEYFDELSFAISQRITSPNIEFIAVNPYKSCIIETDKTRMTQVWHNFITNAIKYTVSGHIKMGYEYVNNGIKLYVEDTGIGIPVEKQGKLFKRFEKLDSFAQGTGLGLSICKAITELHGGEIGCDSVEGKGSFFWSWKPIKAQVVYKTSVEEIPATVKSEQTSNADIENYLAGRDCRILVAEDNDSNYLLVSHILKNNFQISRAVNGAEAVEFVKNGNVDLVLMDVRMPIMDGLQATRNIRKFNRDIPIIALTANAFNTDRDEALKCGCNDFLAKPLRKADLLFAMYRIAKQIQMCEQ